MPNWFEKHGNTLITVAAIILAFGALVAIIDQRLDAQDRLFSQRFDAQDKYIDQRFDAQERYINQRFDAQDKRIDRLAEEVSELRKLLVGVNERVSRNEGRIDVILEQIQAADAPSPPD